MKPATPLPWGTDYSTACYWDVIAGGKQLCTLFDDDGNEANGYRTQSGYSVHQAEQDATYIVHAANLYPELVEACQLALEHKADEYRGTFDSRMDNDPLVIRLRAVLAKAKGE